MSSPGPSTVNRTGLSARGAVTPAASAIRAVTNTRSVPSTLIVERSAEGSSPARGLSALPRDELPAPRRWYRSAIGDRIKVRLARLEHRRSSEQELELGVLMGVSCALSQG